MQSRRAFLGALSVPAAALAAASGRLPLPRASAAEIVAELAATRGEPDEIARDETYWRHAQEAFTVDRSLINFNNGGVSPSPRWVQEAMRQHQELSNKAPAYYMWQILEPRREVVRTRLARQWGADAEEIAITRNSSEALQICQLGLDLKPGDEILTTTQDYPRMLTTFRQRERREGVVLRQFKVPVPAEDPSEVVRLFERNITDRTRVILACHMINLTGQILPIREIAAMARRRGIPVIVDGAHALAHFDFMLSDLGCDYYGVSLHKWLFAPHGTGLLYVRREKIAGLWPMMAAPPEMEGDIRKFEEIGTHPAANFLAIAEALTFHQGLGPKRKEARMVYLRERWMGRLAGLDRVRFHTSRRPGLACGIGTVQVEGIASNELNQWLWDRHRIFTTAIVHEEFEGLRVSPSVYSTLEEVDRFCEAMETAVARGIGA